MDTEPLFENFLKKKNFPFEKSKTLRKIFKKGQEETAIHTGDHPQALLATHAHCLPHTRGVSHTTPLHPYLGWGHDVPLGGGYPPIHEKFLWSRIA